MKIIATLILLPFVVLENTLNFVTTLAGAILELLDIIGISKIQKIAAYLEIAFSDEEFRKTLSEITESIK